MKNVDVEEVVSKIINDDLIRTIEFEKNTDFELPRITMSGIQYQ